MKFDIDRTEVLTMNVLKDFQRATVERIDALFRGGQKRILVADEVGMGKTLIARGAIVKTARLRIEEGDELFKVVYICSNISIANQNIRKLKVSDSATIEGVSDTRLSMQHLKITQQELSQELRDGFIQLIPLTPDTSFRMTNGGGTANERALMYAVLRRMPELSGDLPELRRYLKYSVWKEESWNNYLEYYERLVSDCEKKTEGKYPYDLIGKIRAYDREEPVIGLLLKHLEDRKDKDKKNEYSDMSILNRLRVMFARLSTEMLQPDLVIMDEFQRFRFLISSDRNSDTGILAHQFLEGGDTRVLLLSATPYKLYSTLEEIDDANGVDEHYREFLQVMEFLLGGKTTEFRKVWSDYNTALHELKEGDTSIIRIKDAAEDAMYEGVCRTERISVMESGDYTDDSSVKHPIQVTKEDIRSFLEMGKLLKNIGASFSLPVDYAKSCPFLMSFMRNYKVKQRIEQYFQKNPEAVGLADNDLLWVDPERVNSYQSLPSSNARLEKLKEVAFENHAELYLWIPPSRPYYEMSGVYSNSRQFSKVLVFSSWEMVPRMIGAMISYEMECLSVGRVCENAGDIERGNAQYNAKRRYPYQRLRFALKEGDPQRMTLFCLMYPSRTLAEMYSPIAAINAGRTLQETEDDIRIKVEERLQGLKKYQKVETRFPDARWYYMTPMLMDGRDYAEGWIRSLIQAMENASEDGEDGISSDRGNKAFLAHVDRLSQLLSSGEELELGTIPDDLTDTLVNMALGSPAVCIYRSNRGNVLHATALARTFLNYFNTTESTAIIMLAAEQYHIQEADDSAHWQDVLRYCKDGCFQAMFDEYRHLIEEASGFSSDRNKEDRIHRTMLNDLRIHTASYDVDTYAKFCDRVSGGKGRNLMRAHYAVGFINSEGTDNIKDANRKDSIRGAFNSPLKPFVLATTSIGQEGLDFHNYCRRIMHWNLPSNPIDLEQREGRINRFKCLAIRQNVAEKYGRIHFYDDIWKEMFAAAEAEKNANQSELVPYWCFGKDQSVKIERIVPMYPMSKDEISYERLIKILSLYRLTLGQARQEELLEYLFSECENPEELKKLFIDLSPFSKEGALHKDEAGREIQVNENRPAGRTIDMKKASGKNMLIEKAIRKYIEDYDENNHRDDGSLRNETLKWIATANFAMNWDINAKDMLSMWKKCMKCAFIDTGYNHPTQGITILLKKPEEQEGVRDAFCNLFQKGSDDLEDKWNRILQFMDYINGRLSTLYPNSSIYLQTKEAVITYLNLWDPDHNYRYKPAPANNWASFIGFEDWGTGQWFSLRKYYRMCDEILEVVKNHDELLQIHRQRFDNGLPDCDKALHILTFDILYCFWGKDEAQREARQEYEEAMRQQRIDELETQLLEIDHRIREKTAQIKEINCVGLPVRHKTFGAGIVEDVEKTRIIIEFETKGQKTLQHPRSIIDGLLQFEDAAIKDRFGQNDRIRKEIDELKGQRKKAEEELEAFISTDMMIS